MGPPLLNVRICTNQQKTRERSAIVPEPVRTPRLHLERVPVSSHQAPSAALKLLPHVRCPLLPEVSFTPSARELLFLQMQHTANAKQNETKGGVGMRWKRMVLENQYFALVSVTESDEIIGQRVIGE